MTPGDYSEDELIEQPAIALLEELGWEYMNCFDELATNRALGRDSSGDVVLEPKLEAALRRLNPGLAPAGIAQAAEELAKDRSALSLVAANREIYQLLKDGVKVRVTDVRGEDADETVRVIDWNDPDNNDFFLASQLWVMGDMYKRRPDLIGFVNGLPLLLIELKAGNQYLENAYRNNLRDYKDTIPHIFWHNAFIILSNGSDSRVGSLTSGWEHFAEWKKVGSETEPDSISLETVIRGSCDKTRFLDLVENFILFKVAKAGTAKITAKNHQFLGVNNAVESVRRLNENRGRLGVVWHTQGAGKSISMIFFSQKVLRKLPGNYTFVIVTDRQELDGQIYKNFTDSGVVTEAEVQAKSGAHLKQLLSEDHRHVFTLIQKFRTEGDAPYPELSDRSDVIVITDEAHRSQYDTFAMNMRRALPNAAFIGFTGTPLIVGEEKTREVFGDYVSVYNFRQSIADGATVPLYYENRIPELQLNDQDIFREELQRVIDEGELDPDQESKLEREFAKEYHLITRDDRLEKVAEDIVAHFMGRGYLGKAMVVCIDKATAVRMYDKVRRYWQSHIDGLKAELAAVSIPEREHLQAQIKFMVETDMAVVVSQAQNEIADLEAKGLDIKPHRKRIVQEDMETKFKDVKDPFRLVFVCAMWMTGFDAPDCSTIYLDKPMRNHTLMQTIARANRVYGDKQNGLIVDYIGVFRNLQKALAIYGPASGGRVGPGDTPVEAKAVLVAALREAVMGVGDFCRGRGIDLAQIQSTQAPFDKIRLLDDARDIIIVNEETKREFIGLAGQVVWMYKALLPDPRAQEFAGVRGVLYELLLRIRLLIPRPDISEMTAAIDALLDQHIAAEGYIIRAPAVEEQKEHLVDLSRIDFKKLEERFLKGRRRTEAERLKQLISGKVNLMVQQNPTRMHLFDKFRELIDEYNQGALNTEEFFNALVKLGKTLNEEDKRAISENLSEEELTIFDMLTRPEIDLTDKERAQVKKVAKELMETLNTEKLVLDWRKKWDSRAAVKVSIGQILDNLPERYTKPVYEEKCERIYHHVYDNYYGEGLSVFTELGAGEGVKTIKR